MKNLIIRNATLDDIETIIDFNYKLALETENKILNKQTLAAGVRSILQDNNKGFYILAQLDNKIIGQLMITYEWSDWRNAYFWWIQSLYILPEYRKSGVFKTLFEYIKNLATNRKDICGLRLYTDENNINAIKSFTKMGMNQSNYLMFDMEFNQKI